MRSKLESVFMFFSAFSRFVCALFKNWFVRKCRISSFSDQKWLQNRNFWTKLKARAQLRVLQFMEVSFDMEDVLNRNLLWRRPNNVPWPNVWHRFEAKSKSGQTYQIKIQDITEDRFEDVLDFMATEFDKKEPICSWVVSNTLYIYFYYKTNIMSNFIHHWDLLNRWKFSTKDLYWIISLRILFLFFCFFSSLAH